MKNMMIILPLLTYLFYAVQSSSNILTVLSTDHNDYSDGKYFNFDIAIIDDFLGRSDWNNEVFIVFHQRTETQRRVRVWRDNNGGSVGNGHGRIDPKDASTTNDWQTDDIVELTDISPYDTDTFEVQSVDHSNLFSDGRYFNFDISAIDTILGRSDWDSEIFTVYNDRTQISLNVRIWRDNNGGSVGDGHGRREPYDDSSRSDWETGDLLTFIDLEDITTYAPTDYDHSKALIALYYSYTSKCQAENLRAWDCLWCTFDAEVNQFQPLSVIETEFLQGFIGFDPVNSRLIVVFRGSDNRENWFDTNLDLPLISYPNAQQVIDPKVFRGMFRAFQVLEDAGLRQAIQEAFIKYPGVDILCTGHSLGGALTMITALELKGNSVYNSLDIGHVDVITFGAPRVFNKNLALHFNAIIRTNWRVVNRYDIVTSIPTKFMGYYHVSTQIWYENTESDQYYQCDGSGEDPYCFGIKFKINEFPQVKYHLNYFGIDTGALSGGKNCEGLPLPTIIERDPLNTFDVLSVNHKHLLSNGRYFNFDISTIDEILGRTDWSSEVFEVYSERKTAVYQVIIWRNSNGGSIGDGHGRKHPYSDSAKGDWQKDEELMLVRVDRSDDDIGVLGIFSVDITAENKECVWTLDDGSKLDLSSLREEYDAQSANGFALNAVTPCRNEIVEGMNCEATRSMVSWNPTGESCLRPLAVWDNGVVQPSYNSELNQWKFVYDNGETCDGEQSTFELFYVCDEEVETLEIKKFEKDVESCTYQMYISTSRACVE